MPCRGRFRFAAGPRCDIEGLFEVACTTSHVPLKRNADCCVEVGLVALATGDNDPLGDREESAPALDDWAGRGDWGLGDRLGLRPELGRPDPGRPEAGRPEVGRPELGRPEPGRPDPGRPDPGCDPGLVSPPLFKDTTLGTTAVRGRSVVRLVGRSARLSVT